MDDLLNQRLVSDAELEKFGPVDLLQSKIAALYKHQLNSWELLRSNSEELAQSLFKSIQFDGFSFSVQHIPHRIKSTAANLDREFIAKRKSFLKLENLPKQQKGVLFQNRYIFLANPYPIFPMHFTIPSIEQMPQQVEPHLDALFDLTLQLAPEFAVLYNGAQCGASAPDHFHFQAGNSGFLNIVREYQTLVKMFSRVISEAKQVKVFAVDDRIRKFFVVESEDKSAGIDTLKKVVSSMQFEKVGIEPIFNMLAFFDDCYRVVIFPRSKHRPEAYFLEEPDRLVISPAIVDLCGNLIVPRAEDFEKVSADILQSIFAEVSIGQEKFKKFCDIISSEID